MSSFNFIASHRMQVHPRHSNREKTDQQHASTSSFGPLSQLGLHALQKFKIIKKNKERQTIMKTTANSENLGIEFLLCGGPLTICAGSCSVGWRSSESLPAQDWACTEGRRLGNSDVEDSRWVIWHVPGKAKDTCQARGMCLDVRFCADFGETRRILGLLEGQRGSAQSYWDLRKQQMVPKLDVAVAPF